jgi:hypothetical protein
MAPLIHCDIPAAEVALDETFQTVPETSIVCKQSVACSNMAPFPLIWARTTDGRGSTAPERSR